MFRVGQKVVCIDDSPGRHCRRKLLQQGVVYIVTGVDRDTVDKPADKWGVYLAGVPNTPWPHSEFPIGWRASRFRPAVERKTSIEIFTKMLTGNRENIDA